MHTKFIASTIILTSSVALAARSLADVKQFTFYPAQKCKEGGFDLCDKPTSAISPCGDGTYCSASGCGTWGGKKGCCQGPADQSQEDIFDKLIFACKRFESQLKNLDTSKGDEIIKSEKTCSDTKNYFPAAVDTSEGFEVLFGNKTTLSTCCPIDKDTVTVYDDFLQTIKSAKCIEPLGGGSSSGGSSTGAASNLLPNLGGLATVALFVAVGLL